MLEIMTEQRSYTIMGLANHLHTSRNTLLDYESGIHVEKALEFDESGESGGSITVLPGSRVDDHV